MRNTGASGLVRLAAALATLACGAIPGHARDMGAGGVTGAEILGLLGATDVGKGVTLLSAVSTRGTDLRLRIKEDFGLVI